MVSASRGHRLLVEREFLAGLFHAGVMGRPPYSNGFLLLI